VLSSAERTKRWRDRNAGKLCTVCGTAKRTSRSPRCTQCTRDQNRRFYGGCIERGVCVVCAENPPTKGRLCGSCSVSRNQRLRSARRLLKSQAVCYLGDACVDCGLRTEYLSVYDFHHKDPSQKDFNLGRLLGSTCDWDIISSELNKCDLLCANCHRIRHEKEGKGEVE